MIIRGERNGEIILVNQTDHSQLVGQLASHWGNSSFAAPHPYESVVRCATFHDYGWLPYETRPSVDQQSGKPYGFMQVGMNKPQLDAYQWAMDWMSQLDSYAGLVMNMHRTGLWRARYQAIGHPTAFNLKNPSPDVEKFIVRNERWQDEQKKGVDAKTLRINYRLMQVWDLLGLYFCCQEVCEDYIEPAPTSYESGDNEGVRLRMRPSSPTQVTFDPYPFDVRPLRIQLRSKALPARYYAGDSEFRKAYFQAHNQWLEFELT